MAGGRVAKMMRWAPILVLSLLLGGASGLAQEQKQTHAKKREAAEKNAPKAKGKLKLIDLNTATEAELRQLPGVDAAMAKKIVENRPYVSVEDLARSGIPVEVERNARMRVTVTPRTGTSDRTSTETSEKPKEQPKAK
jgi:hypothetical protein